MDRWRPRLEDCGISVEQFVPPDVVSASFDEDALGQILDNLLDNAEKHTRSISERKVLCRLDRHDDHATISVSDNGPGIPRHQRRHIFRPFDRPAPSNATSGLGLGLALARSLARAQGGELELATDDAPGATFVLTLPLS